LAHAFKGSVHGFPVYVLGKSIMVVGVSDKGASSPYGRHVAEKEERTVD
jgi:hypothetical protein